MFWIQFQIDDYFAFRPKLGFLSAHLFQNYLTNYLWRNNFVTDRDALISGSIWKWTVHWIKVHGPSTWKWSAINERDYIIDSCINLDNIILSTVYRHNRYNWAVPENGRSSKKDDLKDRNWMVFEDSSEVQVVDGCTVQVRYKWTVPNWGGLAFWPDFITWHLVSLIFWRFMIIMHKYGLV